jgi:hypothetical protein
MASIINLPDRYLTAAPVIVTSPTTRCGTTLVQRLMCASDNAFVYGEEIGNQFRTLAGLFSTQIRYCDQNSEAMDEAFYLALAGGLRDWRPGLTPPAQILLSAWTDAFYQLPLSLQTFGQVVERPIWGFKWPGCPADVLRTFLILMPRTKVVYVLRNAADALASAKARRFVVTAEEAARYCAEWTRNVQGFEALGDDPRLLLLKYEDLIADRERGLAELAAFTGAENLRAAEFDIKVNTFEGEESEGHSPTQYIAPAPLTGADRDALRAETGEAMARHYPELTIA